MPLGEIVVEGLTRIFCEVLFEGVAYVTGYVILYPFTFGKVKRNFSDNVISLVGVAFWVALIALLIWLPRESGDEIWGIAPSPGMRQTSPHE